MEGVGDGDGVVCSGRERGVLKRRSLTTEAASSVDACLVAPCAFLFCFSDGFPSMVTDTDMSSAVLFSKHKIACMHSISTCHFDRSPSTRPLSRISETCQLRARDRTGSSPQLFPVLVPLNSGLFPRIECT